MGVASAAMLWSCWRGTKGCTAFMQWIIRKIVQGFRDLASAPRSIRHVVGHARALVRLSANAEIARLKADIRAADNRRLELFGGSILSQNDEDGMIAEIFRRVGVTNRRFVEFGTGDGSENNTAALLIQGWSGVWLEGSAEHHATQRSVFDRAIRAGRLVTKQAFLTAENIDSTIASTGLAGPIDLLSIDVDGNDYHLWKAITVVQPRVVVIEYNACVEPPIEWTMPYHSGYVWSGRDAHFSASLAALAALGNRLGYSLVACNIVGLNAFFVKKDLVDGSFCDVDDVAALYHPRRSWLDDAFRHDRLSMRVMIDGVSAETPR